MNDIDKVSDIQVEDVLEYLRIADASDELKGEMKVHLKVAKALVKLNGKFESYEDLDNHEEAVGAVFLECAGLYDNKDPEDGTGKENRVLESIYSLRQPDFISCEPSKKKEGE